MTPMSIKILELLHRFFGCMVVKNILMAAKLFIMGGAVVGVIAGIVFCLVWVYERHPEFLAFGVLGILVTCLCGIIGAFIQFEILDKRN